MIVSVRNPTPVLRSDPSINTFWVPGGRRNGGTGVGTAVAGGGGEPYVPGDGQFSGVGGTMGGEADVGVTAEGANGVPGAVEAAAAFGGACVPGAAFHPEEQPTSSQPRAQTSCARFIGGRRLPAS